MFGVVVWGGSVEAGVSGGPSPDVHQGSLDRALPSLGRTEERADRRWRLSGKRVRCAMCNVRSRQCSRLGGRGRGGSLAGRRSVPGCPQKSLLPRARLGTATGTSHELKSESPTNSLCPAASARELD